VDSVIPPGGITATAAAAIIDECAAKVEEAERERDEAKTALEQERYFHTGTEDKLQEARAEAARLAGILTRIATDTISTRHEAEAWAAEALAAAPRATAMSEAVRELVTLGKELQDLYDCVALGWPFDMSDRKRRLDEVLANPALKGLVPDA